MEWANLGLWALLSRDEKGKLTKLWKELESNHLLEDVLSGYPANHGAKHIKHVLTKLDAILTAQEVRWGGAALVGLAAAAIHDIGMAKMTASAKTNKAVREQHASATTYESIARERLAAAGFEDAEATNAIDVASAHADDPGKTAAEKLVEIEATVSDPGRGLLPHVAVALRLADHLDLGPDRLIPDAEERLFRGKQYVHLIRHLTLTATLDGRNRSVSLALRGRPATPGRITDLMRLALLRRDHDETRDQVHELNRLFSPLGVTWSVNQINEDLTGGLWPSIANGGLFGRELDRALRDAGRSPIEIDMVGHSLHGRFVKNVEELNKRLFRLLGDRVSHLRVLVLDDRVHSQQIAEVLDAQRTHEKGERRRIVSPEDGKGDIEEAIDRLRDDLSCREGRKGLWTAEARQTTSLMYTSMTRFGDRMIVTPYLAGGLSKQSPAIVVNSKSPLFQSYKEEFTRMWDLRPNARLVLHRTTLAPPRALGELNKLVFGAGAFAWHECERFTIQAVLDRYPRWCAGEAVAPFEVEVQPSSKCGLRCLHCVGAHLQRPNGGSGFLPPKATDSLVGCTTGGQCIPRFRVSGLLGDPLYQQACEATLEFIAEASGQGAKTVLLTNGVGLDTNVAQRLAECKTAVHVALDATTAGTYLAMKGEDSFEAVTANVKYLTSRPGRSDVGIGFVVTNGNYREAVAAVANAQSHGADFVRFKPDIRGHGQLSWSLWQYVESELDRAYPNHEHEGTKIIRTQIPWHGTTAHGTRKCWAQFLCTTVGADASVWPCDHLAGCPGVEPFGNLTGKTFEEIWTDSRTQDRLGEVLPQCTLCPPFNWRFNRFMEQLVVLEESVGWDDVATWLRSHLR